MEDTILEPPHPVFGVSPFIFYIYHAYTKQRKRIEDTTHYSAIVLTFHCKDLIIKYDRLTKCIE